MSKQEKQSSRAKVDLPGGKVEIRSLEKFMSGKSNFRQIKNIVDKLMPSLRDSYQYGHSNISVLRANIALALNEDSKESFLSPNERKQILVLYQLAQKIDKITNAEGYDKDVLINQLGDIAEAGPEIKASWKKDIKIITGVSGKIEIEAEYTALNQFKGNLAAWVGEIFASVIREDDRLFNKYLSEIDISELQGSPTIVQDVESALLSVFSTVKGKKNFSGKPPKATRTSTKNKPKQKSTKTKRKSLPKIRARQANKGVSSTPLQLIGLINKQLPQVVAKNMKSPALNFQTGRFASGVRITDIVTTPQGFPSIGYTYDKYPYQTFEPGFAQGDPDKDPRKLINRSIREIAAQYAIGRFYTRRV